ncbi:MAG TPA: ABC transporter permease subunit [Chthoniobacteraceae bacterium]|nr:ABC transporter permease subunit [Chthoniobacteraceae bacterium]
MSTENRPDTASTQTEAPAPRNLALHPPHKAFSVGRVSAIARNTLLELIRLKVFYFLLIFALVLIGSSAFMIQFSFQEQFQVLKDVSLGAMSIFTWLLAVLATAMLLPKDIEDRTLYTILAKPVPRFEYLLGKLIGVLVLLALSTLIMGALFAIVLYARQEIVIAETLRGGGMEGGQEQVDAMIREIKASTFTWSLIPGVIAIYLKAALFAALTLLISTFATSWIFTIVTSVAIYFIGHIQSVARDYWLADQGGTVLTKVFLALVSLLFPDLQLFNLVDDIVAGNAIATLLFLKTAALGGIYIAVYLFLAYFIFLKKEL